MCRFTKDKCPHLLSLASADTLTVGLAKSSFIINLRVLSQGKV